MVTLNSLDGVFALEVFPIHKQITVSNLFSIAFSYLVIFLCYHVLSLKPKIPSLKENIKEGD